MALAAPARVSGQEFGGLLRMAAGRATDAAALRRFDAMVDTLAVDGRLRALPPQADPDLPGRTHQYFQQFHDGVPVRGGGVTRQQAAGATVSLSGAVVEDIDVSTAPGLQAAEALARLERLTAARPLSAGLPELVVLPLLAGGHVLAYEAVMDDLRRYWIDAHSGSIVRQESIVRRQAAVGAGPGIRGQQKKLSVRDIGGRFEAYDLLRPATIITLDMRHDVERAFGLVESKQIWADSDIASDADNAWSDAAVVDSQAHVGLTYDYFRAVHGWSGMSGRDATRIFSLVNIGRDFANAFYAPSPAGPEGQGVIVFGEEDSGTPLVPADIVAHEFTHGVNHNTVLRRTGVGLFDSVGGVLGPSSFTHRGRTHRCGEVYTWNDRQIPELAGRRYSLLCHEGRYVLFVNVGGAVHEAWADVFATAVEWRLHDPPLGPLRADYELGEDTPPAFRSLSNPRSKLVAPPRVGVRIPFPDASSAMVRFLVVRLEGSNAAFASNYWTADHGRTVHFLPTYGYEAVHWNSTVFSHAYYLAVEGGRNATTGLAVQGVGGSRRGEIERVFFRAMARFMPPLPRLADVPWSLRQAALDLYGVRSTTYRAVDQALNAVGLPAVRP